MVIIFVLLVFVLAQAFLSVALTGRDQALAKLNQQMSELSDLLALERGRSAEMKQSVGQLSHDLQAANDAREALAQQAASLHDDATHAAAERDQLRAERDRLAAQLADAALRAQAASNRAEQLQSQLTDAVGRTDSAGRETAAVTAELGDTRRQLAAAQAQLAQMQARISALDRTVQTDRDTIDARVSEVAKLAEQVRALTALRDDLEKHAQEAADKSAAEATQLSQSARAQVALLNQQLDELRGQMVQVSKALDISQQSGRDKDAQIVNLGARLNTALAAKVEELQRYRSEFFGKLRSVLDNRPGIQVVGDRFVFQSEVLFPVGGADITPTGQEQIRTLADTIKQIAGEIPADVNWILRVDGHADRQKITGGAFASNWELSAARAITVVKLLIADGVPAEHLAATAFGDNRPLDNADTPDAYARNRRIELRLTDR